MLTFLKLIYYVILTISFFSPALSIKALIVSDYILHDILLYYDMYNPIFTLLVSLLLLFVMIYCNNKRLTLFYQCFLCSIIGVMMFMNVIDVQNFGVFVELSIYLLLYLLIFNHKIITVIFDTFILSVILISTVGSILAFDESIKSYYINTNTTQDDILKYSINTKTYLFVSKFQGWT